MKALQISHRQKTIIAPGRMGGKPRSRLIVQIIVFRPQDLSRPAKGGDGLRKQLFHGRNQLRADGVAGQGRISVAFVLPPFLRKNCQRAAQRIPGNMQKRPPHRGMIFPHAGQPVAARAVHQMQQQRFRLIVPVMGQGQGFRLRFPHRLSERLIAGLPGRRLRAAALRNPHALDHQRHRKPSAQIRAEALFLRSGLSQPVIHIHGEN